MRRLAATCFGSFADPDTVTAWRAMTPPEGAVLACDGADVVGMSIALDLEMTVPGGQVLPMAGISWVAVAPTHRRRGLLRAMFTELHRRIADAQYPLSGLLASEATIYGRFGYGPATIENTLRVDRRMAQMHAGVPRLGGVRIVDPAEHRDALADIYDRWRRHTPGGLHTPAVMWDEVLADRESARHGGSRFFTLLHRDGFAMYRTHTTETDRSVEVTKFAAVTTTARIALWQALLGLDLMETITVDNPPRRPTALPARRPSAGPHRRQRGRTVATNRRYTDGFGSAHVFERRRGHRGGVRRRARWWRAVRPVRQQWAGALCTERGHPRRAPGSVGAGQHLPWGASAVGVRDRASASV